ncbi:MAG: hypothetical protein WBV82_33540, partial [Myxococcaceae bacterium]
MSRPRRTDRWFFSQARRLRRASISEGTPMFAFVDFSPSRSLLRAVLLLSVAASAAASAAEPAQMEGAESAGEQPLNDVEYFL